MAEEEQQDWELRPDIDAVISYCVERWHHDIERAHIVAVGRPKAAKKHGKQVWASLKKASRLEQVLYEALALDQVRRVTEREDPLDRRHAGRFEERRDVGLPGPVALDDRVKFFYVVRAERPLAGLCVPIGVAELVVDQRPALGLRQAVPHLEGDDHDVVELAALGEDGLIDLASGPLAEYLRPKAGPEGCTSVTISAEGRSVTLHADGRTEQT